MALSAPKRPNRRLKKASYMSFRKLPPLPSIEVKNNPEISIADTSGILVNSLPLNLPEEDKVMHRKWVKLRTEYWLENFSASGLLFRVYCDNAIPDGCEVQEMSTWIEGSKKSQCLKITLKSLIFHFKMIFKHCVQTQFPFPYLVAVKLKN